ncbi:Fic/DOC family N-terminal domain-containing protein [Actinomyces timonensis]|uniref:Fic/DOC family N-terminal domain-containing protein n=1 Tax=Actinomyces timonensis TaxID=1288391 RepID=A0AAU8N4N6_9ACTO
MFRNPAMGQLVTISGSDRLRGSWEHKAFVPTPLPHAEPELGGATYRAVAAAGRALAALDATARRLPNPYLLRTPSLRREAQATSALEGTYAPLADVLTADDESPTTVEMREILNYVDMAKTGFEWVDEGRPLTLGLVEDLQGQLMRGTALERESGRLRTSQVVIGRRAGAGRDLPPVEAARFVPAPPGDQLRAGVEDLLTWVGTDHSERIDPVVVVGMAHYQFETLHPFRDGNGRLGRYLIVLTLLCHGLLTEPTLTVSPWFEARRAQYYDALLRVSTDGDWDTFLTFFAHGLADAATTTRKQMLELVEVQEALRQQVRASHLRSARAQDVVDLAVAHPSFTVRTVERETGLSYGRANSLVGQLVELGILTELSARSSSRRFTAPQVLSVLLSGA